MRARPFAATDALTLLLMVLGATLLAMAIVGAVVLAQPGAPPPALVVDGPPEEAATLLGVDATPGTASLLRVGDHVDVLGYFVGQASGQDNVTRVLLADVAVVSIAQDGGRAALTLALSPASALVLHEAETLGVKPLVVLRSETGAVAYPAALADSELVARLSGTRQDQVAVNAP
jgi:hypothetical protein